jgi:hypothetical protein
LSVGRRAKLRWEKEKTKERERMKEGKRDEG